MYPPTLGTAQLRFFPFFFNFFSFLFFFNFFSIPFLGFVPSCIYITCTRAGQGRAGQGRAGSVCCRQGVCKELYTVSIYRSYPQIWRENTYVTYLHTYVVCTSIYAVDSTRLDLTRLDQVYLYTQKYVLCTYP